MNVAATIFLPEKNLNYNINQTIKLLTRCTSVDFIQTREERKGSYYDKPTIGSTDQGLEIKLKNTTSENYIDQGLVSNSNSDSQSYQRNCLPQVIPRTKNKVNNQIHIIPFTQSYQQIMHKCVNDYNNFQKYKDMIVIKFQINQKAISCINSRVVFTRTTIKNHVNTHNRKT